MITNIELNVGELGAVTSPTRRVYIVDDDSDVRTSTYFFLSAAGYFVRSFASGQDFLDEVANLPPGCVLLDLRMPGVGGLDVLHALSRRIGCLPVVVITGHGNIDAAVRSMKLGAIDFVEKPYEESVLIETLARAFAKLDADTRCVNDTARARSLIAALSEREREVFQGVIVGLPNKQIAHRLGLSVRTVEMHRTRMMHRLEARTLADVMCIAFDANNEPSAATTENAR